MRYVAIDPSGSFNEGKGHTGISIVDDWNWNTLKTLSYSAKSYPDRHTYWGTIIDTITGNCCKDGVVIIESFVVRSNGFLVGKMPETSLLIGALVYIKSDKAYYYLNGIMTNDHERDSLKHLLYFMKYGGVVNGS